MSFSNIALGVLIGGAVGATFGRALSDSSSKIDIFKKKAEQVRGFHNIIGDTIRLRGEMGKLSDKSGETFGKLLSAHEKNIAKLKEHGFAVGNLDKDYARLGRTVEGLELSAQGHARIGKGVAQAQDGFRIGAAVAATATAPVIANADYQAIVRDIAIKGGIARTGDEKTMSESIQQDATDTGMNHNELANAVNALVSGGMKVSESTAMAKLIGKFSIGQKADSTDVAKMILALRQAGINDPKVMESMLGKIAVAGDLGSFESNDMAKHFASLMPQLTAFGMSGESAALSLANMLQIQRLAAGSADEAAVNMANLLSKMTSNDSKQKFADNGINLEGSMAVRIASGLDPIESFLDVVEKSIARRDPKKAKELADLQEKIATAQDPGAAQKMLDGYLEMAELSEYISDRQAKQAALAALQNKKLAAENKKTIETKDGQAKIEQDLADRRAASAAKWGEAGSAINRAMVKIGGAIEPVTNVIADGVTKLANAVGGFAEKSQEAVIGVVALGATVAAVKTARGLWNVGRGAIDVVRGGAMSMGGRGILGRVLGGKAGAAGDVVANALGGADAQPVFVTNWPIGGAMDFMDGGGGGKGKPGRAAASSRLGKAAGFVGRNAVKLGGVLALAGSAYQAYDTFENATTANEKAEGYGGAAGGLAGGLAGAKVGAMVGAFAGPIGLAIGGVLGGVVGSIGGSEIGGFLSKQLFGDDENEAAEESKEKAAPPAPEVREVSGTFAPNLTIVVEGDMKDPSQVSRELMPHLKRMFDEYVAQQSRSGLYDGAHL